MVKVPGVVGYDLETTKAILTNAGVGMIVKEEKYSDDYAKGVVMEQHTKAGTEIKKDSAIEVTISKGKKPVEMPSVVGKTKDEAVAILKNAGFILIEFVDASDYSAEAKGTVLAQNIAAGTEVAKDDAEKTKVVITLSIGPKPETEKPTETPTEKPTETPTEKPTETPTETPTEEPDTSVGGGNTTPGETTPPGDTTTPPETQTP